MGVCICKPLPKAENKAQVKALMLISIEKGNLNHVMFIYKRYIKASKNVYQIPLL
jgi:hypothetical protein